MKLKRYLQHNPLVRLNERKAVLQNQSKSSGSGRARQPASDIIHASYFSGKYVGPCMIPESTLQEF